MASLLLLGSKPDPILPPADAIGAVACANASGFSAARHGLPDPDFTVISAILGLGGAARADKSKRQANARALAALAGLRTRELYFLPRPLPRDPLRALVRRAKLWRASAWYLRRCLARAGYRYERFVDPGYGFYLGLVRHECGDDPAVDVQIAAKQPSTGAFALALALARPEYERIILAGFSFELTHAYAWNPTIDELGTTMSKHADTDAMVMAALARTHGGRILTTEPVVAERCGIALLE